MAVLAAAQLLDELMGRHRNTNPDEKIREPDWEDPEYCKYYMVRFCPHDLFVNTRADLGACYKVHDDEVKALFEKSESNFRKKQYIDEFLRFCRNMIAEVERKIQKGKQRLELMNKKSEMPVMTQAQSEENQQQLKDMNDKISKLVNEAEEAGLRGDVEQAQALMEECDKLKEEREELVKQAENSHYSLTAELAAAQEKQMEVCQVCGAFLIVGDAQSRIDDHLMGKQHVGYFRLREAFEEIQTAREKESRERDLKRRDRSGRDRDRKDRDRTDRDRDRGGRDRDRDRDRGDKDRERVEKDRSRNDKEADRSDRDRSRIDKDRIRDDRDRGEKERDKGEKEREKGDKDRERGDKDRDRSDKDRDRGDKSRLKNEKDKVKNEKDREGNDRDRSERDKERERERSHRSSRDERGVRPSDRDRERDRRHRESSRDRFRRHRSKSRDRSRR